jgi:hypothetical protein
LARWSLGSFGAPVVGFVRRAEFGFVRRAEFGFVRRGALTAKMAGGFVRSQESAVRSQPSAFSRLKPDACTLTAKMAGGFVRRAHFRPGKIVGFSQFEGNVAHTFRDGGGIDVRIAKEQRFMVAMRVSVKLR